MPHVFVTGASGFIGYRLVQELVRRGNVVHALVRGEKPKPPPGFSAGDQIDFDHPNIRIVRGDITDRESLRRGMEGCSQVYHLAGYAKNWAPDRQAYFQSNIVGLCHVCDVAKQLAVQRIVWTSTVLSFGPTARGTVGDETTVKTTKALTEYEHSKWCAELDAAAYVEDGLPLVTVNPCRVFGPGQLNESNSVTRLIEMYDRGKVPFLLGGQNVGNWVYIDDVVNGLILAMERGRVGEKYILGGENLSLKDFFRLVDKVSGKRHRQITIRRLAAMVYAYFQKLRAEKFGVYPQITPDWVRVFLIDWAYSSAKAQRELGYQITPLENAVRQTYEWLLRVRAERAQ